jgi:DHA1 family bicyclomycin/chloramphenicol resistance-like MFS transporter
LLGLLVFGVGALVSIVATSFSTLLWARVLQGIGGAAARVISVAIVRDLYTGRQMARVMSMVMMVFITVPIIAPSIGQALAHIGSWRWAFYVLLGAAAIGIVWAGLRLPETSQAGSVVPQGYVSTAIAVVTTRPTLGYGVASGFMFGTLVSYIVSAQQVFVDVFALGNAFPIAFAALACSIALASFTNAQLVQRFGMRRLSHLALAGFIAACVLLAGFSLVGQPPLLLFGVLMAAAFFGFGLIVPNFNAIAMQPMGEKAGMASSLIGFFTSGVGVTIGWLVGRLFDGTVRPLSIGFALLGLLALISVLAVEGPKGMFRGE